MTKTIFLLLFATAANAAIQNVNVTEFTATQAILRYQAPDSNACLVEVSEHENLIPLVNDVDPTKFAGAGSDMRPGNLQIGLERTFVIGKRAAEVALNGLRYSRALQASTPHFYRITCPGPQNVTLGSFKTDNIRFGNSYSETQPGDPAQPGVLAQPHLSVNDRTESLIDPQTGMLLKRMTAGQDSFVDIDGYVFTVARSHAWSGVGNLAAQDGVFASITRDSTPLFLGVRAGDPALPYSSGNFNSFANAYSGQHQAFSYFQPHLIAQASSGATGDNAIIQICSTVDAVKCRGPWIDVQLTSRLSDVFAGTKTSGDLLQGSSTASPSWVEQATRFGAVACDGSPNVYFAGGQVFGTHWTAGSTINIAGVDYTIASVTNTRVLSLTSPCPATPSSPYFASNYGVLVRKKTSSADTISIDYAYLNYELIFYDAFVDGEHKLCSEGTVIGPNGNPGYNCHPPGYGNHYWIDAETGESHLFDTTGTTRCGGANEIFDNLNPDKFWCPDGLSHVLYAVTYYGNHSEPTSMWPNGGFRRDQGLNLCNGGQAPYTNQQPCWVVVNSTPGTDVQSLTESFTSNPAYAPAYSKALYGDVTFVDIDVQGRMMFSFPATGHQGYSLGWLMEYDPNATSNSEGGSSLGPVNNHGCVGGGNPGCVIAAMPTWARPGCRWCVYKEGTYAYPGWAYANVYGWQNAPGSGPVYVNGVDGTVNGTLNYLGGADTFVNCPANARGVTGLHCSKITVGSEPFRPSHSGLETGLPGELGAAAVGDRFSPPSSNGGYELAIHPVEQLELVQKDPGLVPGTWVYTLLRGVNYGPGRTDYAVTAANPILYTVCNSNNVPATTSGAYIWVWNFENDPHGINPLGKTIIHSPIDFVGHAFWNQGNYSVVQIPSYDPRCFLQQCYANLVKDPSLNFYDAAMQPIATALVSALSYFSPGAGNIDASALQSHSTNGGSLATQERLNFLFDGRPYRGGQASGSSSRSGDCPATQVSGQLWKFTPNCMFGLELPWRKIYPTSAYSGSFPLIDVSGATSTLTSGSGDSFKYCVAAVAGECVTSSQIGEVYVNVPHLTYPFCFQAGQADNMSDEQDLCISGSPSVRDAIVQVGLNPTDIIGKTTRVLSKFTAPRRMSPFWTPYILPNGKWAMFEAQLTGDMAVNKALMLGKIPPPDLDTIDRTNFVPITLHIPPEGGKSAYVRFGYAENGPPGSFFCTSRLEACVTVTQGEKAADVTNPFYFETAESQKIQPVSCSSGCTITVPGIPTRALYYQVVYLDANSVKTASPMLVTTIP